MPFKYHLLMRWAKSYSIIDHNILHGGYLQRMSREAMALYLFLVVVGDKNGRSFYSESSIMEVLRLEPVELHQAVSELCAMRLIDYRRPYWYVRDISEGGEDDGRFKAKDYVSPGRHETVFSSDRETDRDTAKDRIKAISRMLSER